MKLKQNMLVLNGFGKYGDLFIDQIYSNWIRFDDRHESRTILQRSQRMVGRFEVARYISTGVAPEEVIAILWQP